MSTDTRSLAATAYERLRQGIVTGRLRPNERLVEAELADLFEISRTPVREGLQRLADEGLVSSGRRGWIVREHTADDVREIYEARIALESYAAGLAARRADKATLERIAAVHEQYGDRLVDASPSEQVELNERFHGAVVEACGNSRLSELIRRNREYFFDYTIARHYSRDEMASGVSQHARIVRALKAHDGDAAEKVMREHLEEALTVILTKLY